MPAETVAGLRGPALVFSQDDAAVDPATAPAGWTAYEAFVAESHKISELYADLAKQAFKPFEGYIAKMTPAR